MNDLRVGYEAGFEAGTSEMGEAVRLALRAGVNLEDKDALRKLRQVCQVVKERKWEPGMKYADLHAAGLKLTRIVPDV